MEGEGRKQKGGNGRKASNLGKDRPWKNWDVGKERGEGGKEREQGGKERGKESRLGRKTNNLLFQQHLHVQERERERNKEERKQRKKEESEQMERGKKGCKERKGGRERQKTDSDGYPTYKKEKYTLKWTVAKDVGLIFVV